jgi:non-ribosomal peptide synthetase component F
MNLLPPNVIGEIAIGGDGVGKGYLGKPSLTAAKYLPNKFSNQKKCNNVFLPEILEIADL